MQSKELELRKVRVGRIDYINVAPIYYGLNQSMKPDWMDIVSAPPSVLNAMLAKGFLDISPVSSVAYARHWDQWDLLPGLSISCHGSVMSVLLVGKRPIHQMNEAPVMLTEESETAAHLTRLLFDLNQTSVRWFTGKIRNPEDLPKEAAAGLIIGDAALRIDWSRHFPYVWDLGQVWHQLTRLPFVFGLWAVRKSFALKHPDAVSAVWGQLMTSRDQGFQHMNHLIHGAVQKLRISEKTARKYYKKLHYDLSDEKVNGLLTFFDSLYHHGYLSQKIRLTYFDPRTLHSRYIQAA